MKFAALFVAAAVSLFAFEPGIERAHAHYKRTEYVAAISILKQAPPDAKTLSLLGQCYFMQGEYKRATETLEKAVALNPADSMTYTWLARAWGRRAETSFPVSALGYAKKSREFFEKAYELDPVNMEAINDLYEFYLQAPPVVGGGHDKAAKLLPVIAKIDPVEVHFARARMAEEQKRFDAAEAEYRKAMEMEPRQQGRIIDLAVFLAKHNHFEESEQLFNRAAQLGPNSPRILFARAKAYVRAQRKLDEAQTMLRKYLALTDLTPDDPAKSEDEKLLKKAQGV